MADGKIIIDTTVDNSGAEKDVKSLSGKLGSMASNALGSVTKITAAMATVATGAVAALATLSIKQFAEYEQLVGGVDTLFKDSSKLVQLYADNAYKTAGMSANDYMSTITGFSASLLQGLGGDTKKAAEVGNRAVTDMSDNANKMGTGIENIQNAYQGFAKQNYTMLDNLKLGYGGTKGEMERLLVDAGKLSGMEYSIGNFSDVIEAIHVVQSEMGITGTTALEASETISGSLNATKSAWSNLLVGMADENADFDSLINNLVDSASTFGKNILPRIAVALDGIGLLFARLASELPKIIMAILPGIISSGIEVVSSLGSAIIDSLPILIDLGIDIIESLLDGIQANLPSIVQGAFTALESFITGIIAMLPQILQMGIDIIIQLALGLAKSLPTLIPMAIGAILTLVDTLIDNIDAIIDAGIALLIGLAEGLIVALPILIEKIPIIIDKLLTAITNNLPKLLEMGLKLVLQLALGLVKAIPSLLEAIPKIIVALIDGIKNYYTQIFMLGVDLISQLWEGLKSMGALLMENILLFIDQYIVIPFNSMIDSCVEIWTIVKQTFINGWNNIVTFFTESIPAWWEGVKQSFIDGWNTIVSFFVEAIPALITSIFNWFGELPYKIGYQLGLLLGTIAKWGLDTWTYLSTNVPIWIEAVVTFFSELPGKIWTWLVDAFNKIVQWGTNTYNSATTAISNTVNTIVTFFSELPGKIWTWLVQSITDIVTWGSNLYSTSVTCVSDTINSIVDWFSQLPGRIWTWLCNVVSDISAWGSNMVSQGGSAASDLVNSIVDIISALPGQVLDIGVNIVKGIWEGITSMGSWLLDKVGGFCSGVVSGFMAGFDEHSPSRIMRDLVGVNIVKGIGVGIDIETPNLQKDIDSSLANMTAKMKSTVDYETSKTSQGVVVNASNKVNKTGINSNSDSVSDIPEGNIFIVKNYMDSNEISEFTYKKVNGQLALAGKRVR